MLTQFLTMTTTHKFPLQSRGNGGGRHTLIYGPGDRVQTMDSLKVAYDANGFVAGIDGNTERFRFNGLSQLVEYARNGGGETVQYFYDQGWKFMSCSQCQELGQQANWLLIGCTRGNDQSEAR